MQDEQIDQNQEEESEEEKKAYEARRAEVFKHFLSHFCEDCQAEMLH